MAYLPVFHFKLFKVLSVIEISHILFSLTSNRKTFITKKTESNDSALKNTSNNPSLTSRSSYLTGTH